MTYDQYIASTLHTVAKAVESKTPAIDAFIKAHKPIKVETEDKITDEQRIKASKMLVEIAEKFGGKK